MNEIIWLPTAQKHLDLIYQWLAERSEAAALKLVNDILKETDRLARFPEIGQIERSLENYPNKFRAVVVRRNFKIIYFVESQTIYISAIWDCRKEPRTIHEIFKT